MDIESNLLNKKNTKIQNTTQIHVFRDRLEQHLGSGPSIYFHHFQ